MEKVHKFDGFALTKEGIVYTFGFVVEFYFDGEDFGVLDEG